MPIMITIKMPNIMPIMDNQSMPNMMPIMDNNHHHNMIPIKIPWCARSVLSTTNHLKCHSQQGRRVGPQHTSMPNPNDQSIITAAPACARWRKIGMRRRKLNTYTVHQPGGSALAQSLFLTTLRPAIVTTAQDRYYQPASPKCIWRRLSRRRGRRRSLQRRESFRLLQSLSN